MLVIESYSKVSNFLLLPRLVALVSGQVRKFRVVLDPEERQQFR